MARLEAVARTRPIHACSTQIEWRTTVTNQIDGSHCPTSNQLQCPQALTSLTCLCSRVYNYKVGRHVLKLFSMKLSVIRLSWQKLLIIQLKWMFFITIVSLLKGENRGLVVRGGINVHKQCVVPPKTPCYHTLMIAVLPPSLCHSMRFTGGSSSLHSCLQCCLHDISIF